MTTYKTEVYCTLQIEGTHNWPGCPFDEVAYLRVPHRHVFWIKAYKKVNHDDRDVEFIMLKHQIEASLKAEYYNADKKLCVFGAKSCEMLAKELIFNFGLSRCEVSEDNENGAIVEVLIEDNLFEHLDNSPAILELMPPSAGAPAWPDETCDICGAAPNDPCRTNCEVKC